MKLFFDENKKINIRIGENIIWLDSTRLTFLLNIYNLRTEVHKGYYMQLSTKDMWLMPKRDTVCDGEVTLWGWLFFYIGCNTNMIRNKSEV